MKKENTCIEKEMNEKVEIEYVSTYIMESYMSKSGFDSLFSKVSLIEKAWKYFLINVHPSNEINH